jgi:membrane-bound serine protease (ClpP class)
VRKYGRLESLVLVLFLAVASTSALSQGAGGEKDRRVALVAEITGVIGPPSAHYLEKAIEKARSRQAEVLILRLDTPGGLVTSMRDMIKAILASPIPVVGYVAPPGAHAASAGTYILYATNIAAMAPGTNIGAATPVQIGGIPGLPTPKEPNPDRQAPAPDGKSDKPPDGKPQAPADAMATKSLNDAIALIRGLAELRGRNADWAEKAVREAATLHARQALEEHVIDLVAGDVDELLRALNGRKVVTGNHEERTLSTLGVAVERIEPDFMTRVLGTVANPNIALVLMLIGIYGLIFEFMNPGMVLPGVAGAISLLLGLYALQELPLDYAGLALLLLGIAFMIAEAFAPTFGVLGFGGIVAFVIGAAMLIDTDIPEYRLSWSVIGIAAAVSASFLVLVVGYTWRAQIRKVQSGAEQLIGSKAVVMDWSGNGGHVWIEGERWNARSDWAFAKGDPVKVQERHGLTLVVVPFEPGLKREALQGA